MPSIILSALTHFINNSVNMPSGRVSKSRDSRDWLLENIKIIEKNKNFLYFCNNFNTYFGSFSRRTKIRPVDDIDLMVGLDGHKLHWMDNPQNYKECSIYLKEGIDSGLWDKCLNSDNSLNSTKVLNTFKSSLENIQHYKYAEIHRMQQAITLKLSSYEWNFDLVPCFYTTSGIYLIPNGSGKWMKTDPRKDQEFITFVNQLHSSKFLKLVRLVKYWNTKSFDKKAKFESSYLLEVMLANYYKDKSNFDDLETEFENSLRYLNDNINSEIQDPKGIEGNINRLSDDKKSALRERIENDLDEIDKAKNETKHDNKFSCWKKVLGEKFPN